MYQFCLDQGVETVGKHARELQKGGLYFWWD
jgi:hypothetical protein